MSEGVVNPRRASRRLWGLAGVFVASGFVVAGGVPCQLFVAQPACSVVISPGPTTNVLPALEVTGVDTFEPVRSSALNIATIAVTERLTWRAYLSARRSVSDDVAPRTSVFPVNESRFDTQARNNASMRASQLAAEQAAFSVLYAGLPAPPLGVEIIGHTANSRLSQFAVGTVINRINGVPVGDVDGFWRRLATVRDGAYVTFTSREGKRLGVRVTTDHQDLAQPPPLGVYLADNVALPFAVHVDAGVVGGPSAGLLFGIAIVEWLSEAQLINGLVVSATGTLTKDGTVGAVGGLRQKLYAAGRQDSDVDVFFLPEANLAELARVRVERDLLVIPVASLSQALTALSQLADGDTPPTARMLRA